MIALFIQNRIHLLIGVISKRVSNNNQEADYISRLLDLKLFIENVE